MRKKNLCNFIILICFIFLSIGCTPQIPKRSQIKQGIPPIPQDYGRLYFFNGTYFSTWEMDNNKYGSAGNILINGKRSGTINREEFIVIDLPADKYELSWAPIMADVDLKRRKSRPLTLSVLPGKTYFLAANTRDAGNNVSLWFGAVGYLASDLLYIDTLEETKRLSNTSIRLVDYQCLNSDPKKKNNSATTIELNNDLEVKLLKLKNLYKKGLINKEEYGLSRKRLLDNL